MPFAPVGSAVTFTYNGYGAMTGDSTGRSFTWDGLRRLTQMSSGGVTTSFSYDPLGRRTGLTQGATSKTFFYDGLDMLSDSTNTYLNGQGLDNPLSLNDGTNNHYYLQNQIGSITRLSDSTGSSTGHYQYLPYGGLLSSSTPLTGTPFTFTGREDDGTGLMYYRARYYDPALQVFISQDPLGDDQRYVGGNPVLYSDPFGLDYWLEGPATNEPGMGQHQSVCVGEYGGTRNCYSFGADETSNPQCLFGECSGHVYKDYSNPGPVVFPNFVFSNPATDKQVYDYLGNLAGNPGKYNLLIKNCRVFSQKTFTYLKNNYGGTPYNGINTFKK